MKIREIKNVDIPFLQKMFYSIVSQYEESPMTLQEVIQRPEYKKYHENWGQVGDLGFVAENEKQDSIGVIWIRSFEEEIPEITIAVDSTHRGQGVGKVLMQTMLTKAQENELSKLKLMVDPNNVAACHLYQSLGFQTIACDEETKTMVIYL